MTGNDIVEKCEEHARLYDRLRELVNQDKAYTQEFEDVFTEAYVIAAEIGEAFASGRYYRKLERAAKQDPKLGRVIRAFIEFGKNPNNDTHIEIYKAIYDGAPKDDVIVGKLMRFR